MLRELLRGLLDLLVPPTCAACGGSVGAAARALCSACSARIPRETEEPPPAPRPLAAWVAAAAYEGETLAWIQRFKYPRRGLAGLDPAAAAVVRWLAVEAAARAPGAAPDLVLPVPLHPRRLRARGFNPAGALGRAVAREFGLPFDPVALRRTRDTASQTGLDRRARRRNVRGAFEARRGLPRCVWIVDDVVTTGATLAEAGRALRRAGARRVVAVCVARTPRTRP